MAGWRSKRFLLTDSSIVKIMHKRHILFLLEYFPPHIGGVETLFAKIVEGVLAE